MDWPEPPQRRWGALFDAVQRAGLFEDSKRLADAVPRDDDKAIVDAYEHQRHDAGFDLARFVDKHFELPEPPADVGSQGLAIDAHIRALWPRLLRQDDPAERGSRLPLPHPYIVPGGRFGEIYYWDSAFTMQALLLHGLRAEAQQMLDNFADLVRRYGHVPNSNRSYMLTRSQPPLLFRMVELLAGDEPGRYLDVLRAEHRFWMDGEAGLAPGAAHRRVVRLADGALLNRYWDDGCTPRDEAWREDIATAQEAAPQRPAAEVWRDLRAAAESGWDFSSRWCAEPDRLASIQTTSLLPVDLNALLWGLERTIARAGDAGTCAEFEARAAARAQAMRTHLWSTGQACFVDLHWRRGEQRERCAAALVPLYVGLASQEEAAVTAAVVARDLLAPNGLRTTLHRSAQQWDQPNGWAPLQIMAVEGLLRCGQRELAFEIARRWLAAVERVYAASGKLVEKYDTEREGIGGGGEYPTQDGFGWSNASHVIFQHLIETHER